MYECTFLDATFPHICNILYTSCGIIKWLILCLSVYGEMHTKQKGKTHRTFKRYTNNLISISACNQHNIQLPSISMLIRVYLFNVSYEMHFQQFISACIPFVLRKTKSLSMGYFGLIIVRFSVIMHIITRYKRESYTRFFAQNCMVCVFRIQWSYTYAGYLV